MKILWHSNAPWLGSGYGTQTALFAPRLRDLGHQLVISAFAGLAGQTVEWDGIPCLPGGLTAYGNDVLQAHARHFFGKDPGLVLALYDAWAIDPGAVHGLATAVWSPVHCKPVSAPDLRFYAQTGAQPIAMSRFGEREMTRAGMQPAYVPHGVDTSVFRPLGDDERAAVRDRLGVPQDAFLVVIAAANKGVNPPRKGWAEQLAAFAAFRERHRDARLFVHSMMTGPASMDLRPVIEELGLQDAIHFSDQYAQVTGLYTPAYMASLLGAADVLSNCSYGEGFGLPVLEAQACGTPVVVSDSSAMTELCGSGWLAETQPYWQLDDLSWWHAPRIKSITAAYEKAYRHARSPAMRQKAREFALGYDADTVLTQFWKPALEMLEQYAGAAPVAPPGRNHGSIPLPTAESDGLRWIQRGGHTDDWIATGHEEPLGPVLEAMLPDGGVLLDVGAHVGRWSLRMARKASQVVAVEANPATAAVLRAHIELNNVQNVTVLQAAAWDCETFLDLDDPNQRVTGGSTRVVESSDGRVPAMRLDFPVEITDLDRIDLIKLDVEGADLHALRGMAATLARCRPRLLVERHDIYGYYKLGDLTGLLEELGYAWQKLSITLSGGQEALYLTAEPNGEEQGRGEEDHA
jgi:FkbM family methyltransferase